MYGGGLVFSGENVQLINNIIWGNIAPVGSQIYLWTEETNPNFYYCDIQGGVEAFGGDGAPYFNGDYENCIDSDPLFVDTFLNDVHLQDASPCIGAGIDEILIGEIIYVCPEFDFDGNPRPTPFGSMPDIGAYENQFGEPQVDVNEECIMNNEKCELTNHPNPFNPTTTISFSVTQNSDFVNLEIYNIKGQKIKTLDILESASPSPFFADGVGYSIIWNGTDDGGKPVSSGVYFYKLKSGNFEQTKKMILLR